MRKEFIGKHSVSLSILIALFTGIVITFIHEIARYPGAYSPANPAEIIFAPIILGLLCGIFIIYPIVLTVIQIYLLFRTKDREQLYRRGRIFDIITFSLGNSNI